ncbi:hypothetical protein RND81_07G107800 [Saponaria officinalis]|uniref:Nuclear pore complex protein NUP205 n=3 Tax=Saponaria officinalis TaxID=3572 RepID=A0AAW1JQH6_SAPOF
MVSPKQLLSTIESTLLSSSPPSPSERIELMHAIRSSISSLQNLLSYPPPRPADRTEVQTREVRLPDSPPISLDDQDVQIALKLSDDLHLNEIDCVRLLVSANQECGLLGREPLEILRLAAGLWYTERRDLITALHTLLRAVVLDQGLEGDLVADIQKYLEDLINAGLRQRLVNLIKELNREEPAGLGGPNAERYIIDARGAVVERQAVVSRERLILSHCLVLSILVVRASPKDIKDIFSVLKDSAAELNGCKDVSKYQITFGILFSLVIAFTSDALSTVPEQVSVLSHDASFRQQFQETVMASVSDPIVGGFVDCVRLAWSVHLMLIQEGHAARDTVSDSVSKDFQNIKSCLEVIFSNNVFQFLLEKVLQTAAYQNDDEDIVYMYNAYLHKLISIFLSEPFARDKVKEVKEKVMTMLSPYRMGVPHGFSQFNINSDHAGEMSRQPFISLLELISEIYQKEPELLSGNDVVWTFVNFAAEDHTNFHTLVAFLKMLGALASNQEGASKVFELLRGKTFRSVSWSTMFECLSIYADKFKQSLQSSGSMLPEFPEGDAKALIAYLSVLQKVVEHGNPAEKKNWFPDIEPLFKLLSYENVPPSLKGALRDAIASFIQVSPLMKDTIWGYLEQYDLPVVVGPEVGNTAHAVATQVYDMQFELNEIEARRESYPSTISFINLVNALIAEERDFSDRGRRFVGIFRFIYDQVFGPFPQRAYVDSCEKWQLVVACLHHFRMVLSTYEIREEDIESVADRSQISTVQQAGQLQLHLPVVELMKDFMSGKTVFRNIMSILSPGVNTIIAERTSQIHGHLLEKAVQLSLEIILLVLGKDLQLADFWRPLYQPLDVILSQDHNQIVALLEYVRYDIQPVIQQCSIKIMGALSSRMVELVQLLLKSNAATSLVEDYASCLEIRSQESQKIEDNGDDLGVLILQLLIDNISRPAPNATHLLLKFDLDAPIERTLLQPKFHYSCFKIILEMLDKLLKPDVNAMLHEFSFKLLYNLSIDELTSGPVLDLLSNKRYHFFVKHVDIIGVAPLPKRNSAQALRISSLHQRAWLLKLLAVELHSGDMASSSHREACRKILACLFGKAMDNVEGDQDIATSFALQNGDESAGTRTISKNKALELLDVIQFRPPETTMDYSQVVGNVKCSLLAEQILHASASEKDAVYYHSERGDRLIDLGSFRDKLWQLSAFSNELELNDLREMIQRLLRWAWKYNRNLEEQAAQLHLLTGWSQIVEISASRRLSSLQNRTEILFQLLDASLSASAAPDCSLKMALLLTQVALTAMAKLREYRFLYPIGSNSDALTCLDAIMFKQLSNGACLSILFKLTLAVLRHESSETLRRRQYALLLSYFQYCQHMLDPDVPRGTLQLLLGTDHDNEDVDLGKIDKEQDELARSNFSILQKEAQVILDLVIKDATQGSESGKTISHFVLDALICVDHEKFFLNQLQSRGFLRSCLMSISNFSHQNGRRAMEALQRACTLEAELALMLRISHKYGKAGAQVLSSMGALEHLGSCKALNMPMKGSLRRMETRFGRELTVDVDKQQVIVAPVLRLVLSLTSLVDAADYFEVKNKIVREVIEFVKAHPAVFDWALQESISEANEMVMELIHLVIAILSKTWPYEENDEYGFVQGLFRLMRDLFSLDYESFSSVSSAQSRVTQRKLELKKFHIGFRLSSYLYFQVTKKSLRLQVSDDQSAYRKSGGRQQPTLSLLTDFLNTVTISLERSADEKSLLLNKIQDINELSRQEVDDIISTFAEKARVSPSDNTNTRRYIAMVEMCQIVGDRDQLVTLSVLLAEHLLNVILIHFQDTSYIAGSIESNSLVAYTGSDTKRDFSPLCERLLPILERLELLNEGKVGHSLKVFRRLVTSLKELTIRKLA